MTLTSVSSLVSQIAWPRDGSRVVPLPGGSSAWVRADGPFLLEGLGVRLESDAQENDGWLVQCDLPAVSQPTLVALTVHDEAASGQLRLLLLPDAGETSVPLHGSGPAYGVMATPNGTAAQVRAAWGSIESQYDALLSFNPSSSGPSDRRVVLPRVRQWLKFQHGLLREVNAAAVVDFCQISTTAVRWTFSLAGIRWTTTACLGKKAVTLHLALLEPASADAEVLLRPDLEDRSFHTTTKAFEGAEHGFRAAVAEVGVDGFNFALRDDFTLHAKGERVGFSRADEWCYMVPLPWDAERGLSTATDVFSPGVFTWKPSADPAASLHFSVVASSHVEPDAPVSLQTGTPGEMLLPTAMKRALDLYLARRDDAWTVIAGYPWFLDWGRDSLIFTRGLIAVHRLEDAAGIMRRFAAWEDGGSLPNMVRGTDASDRQTSDAPLWLVTAVKEASRLQPGLLDQVAGGRTLRQVVLDLVAAHASDATAHGVRFDKASGLLWSPSHFTWMDTHNPAGTPREGYPISIQALWAAALEFAHELDAGKGYDEVAAMVRESLTRLFWREDLGHFSDCLHAEIFRPASECDGDDHLRPGQLFAITLGAVTDMAQAKRTLQSCSELLVPGALRTLASRAVTTPLAVQWNGEDLHDPQRPYHGQYTGPEDTCRKPAYHNGTAWPWLFPSYVEALVKCHGREAIADARKLMASSAWLMRDACLGQLPEIIDGDAPHRLRGCGAQAWSISEWLRVWKILH